MSYSFTPAIYYNANEVATIVINITSPDGYAIDPVASPVIKAVFKPDLTTIDGFPQSMSRLGILTGAYVARFQIPSGLSSIGTYIIVVTYVDSITRYEIQALYSIVVGVPFGAGSSVGV